MDLMVVMGDMNARMQEWVAIQVFEVRFGKEWRGSVQREWQMIIAFQQCAQSQDI